MALFKYYMEVIHDHQNSIHKVFRPKHLNGDGLSKGMSISGDNFLEAK